MRVARLVHVGSADRHRADAQQDIVVADLRDGDLAQLHRQRLEGAMNDSSVAGIWRLEIGDLADR